MSILERIHSPADLKALPAEEIPALCAELRSFLVENLAKTGGHLASNLGAVELTVAIDRVYSTEKDRLVFDVGHQSYVHKILTGRREAFSTLRQFGGIAGFPKPDESVHDVFIGIWFMIDKEFNSTRIVKLWAEVFIYSVTIEVVIFVLNPHFNNLQNVILCLFPVFGKRLWFASTYIILLIFAPLLNDIQLQYTCLDPFIQAGTFT